MKKNRSFIYIASAIIAMASCVSCGGGSAPVEDAKFSIQESSVTLKEEDNTIEITLDWTPSDHSIECSDFTFTLKTYSGITSTIEPEASESRPLKLTITFGETLDTDDEGTLTFHYNDKTAKKEGNKTIEGIDIIVPEKPVVVSTTKLFIKRILDEGSTITFDCEVDEGEIEVDWGDSVINSERSHTYTSVRIYPTISIVGKVSSFNLSDESGTLGDKNAMITDIEIGEGVLSLPDYAFKGCTGLTRAFVPASVTSVGKEVFPDSTVYCAFESQPQKGWDDDWAVNVINHDIVWDVTSMEINDDYDYAIVRDNIYIEKFKPNEYKVEVPDEISNLPVKVIGKRAFYNKTTITEIVLPNNLTTINDEAFLGCSDLAKVTFPDTLKSIGNKAFCNAKLGEVDITLCSNLAFIGNNAFDGNINLKEVIIPGGNLVTVGSGIFNQCIRLTSIYCIAEEKPEGWDKNWVGNDHSNVYWGYLGKDTDKGYSFIKTTKGAYITKYEGEYPSPFIIPDTLGDNLPVISLGDHVFENKSAITSLVLPSALKLIGFRTFNECSEITTITVPNTLKSIGKEAFFRCTKLTDFEFPDNLNSIGGYAFSMCGKISEFIIPLSVSTIENYAFDYCAAHIFCKATTKPTGWYDNWYKVNDDSYRNKIHWGYISKGETDDHKYEYMEMQNGGAILKYKGNDVEKLDIPETLKGEEVIGIESCAFLNDNKVSAIHLHNSIKFIREYAFESCNYLTQINIPMSVLDIGEKIVYKAGEDVIGSKISIYCEIREDDVPEGWDDSWSEGAAFGTTCYWDASEPLEKDGYRYIVHSNGIELLSYSGGYSNNTFIIPSTIDDKSVFRIDSNVFGGPTIRTFVVPSQVIEMESSALLTYGADVYCGATSKPQGWADDCFGGGSYNIIWGFDNAQTVNDVDYIRSSEEAYTIGYRGEGESVSISESYDGKPVTCIASNTFYMHSEVTSVTLPNTIRSVGVRAFFTGQHQTLSVDLTSFLVGSTLPTCNESAFDLGFSSITIKISDESIKDLLIENGWPNEESANYVVVAPQA